MKMSQGWRMGAAPAMPLRNPVTARAIALFAATAAFAGLVTFAHAANYVDEYSKQVKSAQAVGVLGPDLFGERTSFYTGSSAFHAVDISLRGNDSLSVQLGRRFRAESTAGGTRPTGAFGDWDLDLPRLEGVFHTAWEGSAGAATRCSVGGAPPFKTFQSTSFAPNEYWSGNQLYLPGGGGGEMLAVNTTYNPNLPADGPTYKWVAGSQWFFSCLPSASNGSGEAFLAIGPDGTRIRFDWIIDRPAPPLNKTASSAPMEFARTGARTRAAKGKDVVPTIFPDGYLTRREVWIYPTRVEDRFGNYVDYIWDAAVPTRLTRIAASDGRQITLSYGTNGNVASASNGSYTWTYIYNLSGLTTVTLPDASQWRYDFAALRQLDFEAVDQGQCSGVEIAFGSPAVGTVTHPSGAIGQFTFGPVKHGRSYVSRQCMPLPTVPESHYAVYAKDFVQVSLLSKRITGPGLVDATWSYTYGPTNASFSDECGSGCPGTKTVEVNGPGEYTRYTFGNRWRQSEGKLLKVETGSSASQLLRTETTTYLFNPAGQAYPTYVGLTPYTRSDRSGERLDPSIGKVISLQGASFSWQVNATSNGVYAFDEFANPASVTRSSSGLAGPATGYARTETTSYYHNRELWVLGQVGTVTDAGSGKVLSQTTYDTTTAMPLKTYGFDLLPQQTLGYDTTSSVSSGQLGTLRTITEGNGDPASKEHTTTLSNWKRGIAQLIEFPSSSTSPPTYKSAVVDDTGWIRSVTDEVASKTCYDYDPMGRLYGITYTSEQSANTCDASAWTATTRSFVPLTAAEVGIPAGHWRETVSTGDAVKIVYYDAMWRPVLAREYDAGNPAGSQSFVKTRYDASGRVEFKSYPSASSAPSTGVWTEHDALGRVIAVSQDSELGLLTTTTSYNAGFTTRVTNPRNQSTTTSYQAFDQPNTQAPVRINLPEGVVTTIVRDTFGKPLSITRGAGN